MSDQKITPFHFFTNRVLPAVYGDELSYYDTLCKVVHTLNEIIDAYNALTPDQYVTDEELTAEISKLVAYIGSENAKQSLQLTAKFLAELQSLKAVLEAEITDVKLEDVLLIDPENSYGRIMLQQILYNQNQNYREFADNALNIDSIGYDCSTRDSMQLTAYIFDFSTSFYYSKGGMPLTNGVDGNYIISMLKKI